MVRCIAITQNKRKCKRSAVDGNYCNQHSGSLKIDLSADYDFWYDNPLNKDIWCTIAQNLHLRSLVSLYKSCKSFYKLFANNEWFTAHPHYVIFEGSDNNYKEVKYTDSNEIVDTLKKYTAKGYSTHIYYESKNIITGKKQSYSSGNIIHIFDKYNPRIHSDYKLFYATRRLDTLHQHLTNFMLLMTAADKTSTAIKELDRSHHSILAFNESDKIIYSTSINIIRLLFEKDRQLRVIEMKNKYIIMDDSEIVCDSALIKNNGEVKLVDSDIEVIDGEVKLVESDI